MGYGAYFPDSLSPQRNERRLSKCGSGSARRSRIARESQRSG
jgi:hypothetical protein